MSDESNKTVPPEQRARQWWADLSGKTGGKKENRGALANLRRCRTPVDALMVPATFNLMQRLPKSNKDRVAVLAVVLAHIRDDSNTHIARSIGLDPNNKDKPALLSEGRFRRLLQTRENDELLTNMVRLVRHMKGTANVEDMAKTILYWGDTTRQRWAFDYYNAGHATPKANDTQDIDHKEART